MLPPPSLESLVRVLPSRMDRLIGVELEIDAGKTLFRRPDQIPSGWVEKGDGSLSNGREYALEPAVKFSRIVPYAKDFEEAFTKAKVNTGKKGGFHVHVQTPDLTKEHYLTLVRAYTHFSPVINKLVAPSRVVNTFCRPHLVGTSDSEIVRMFRLDETAANRQDARYHFSNNRYFAVNLSLVTCREPKQRSVEFRQGSISKLAINIVGWTALMYALTEVAKSNRWEFLRSFDQTPDVFSSLVSTVNPAVGDWIKWRYDYMTTEPTPELIDKVCAEISRVPHGIFYVSRALQVSLLLAKKVCDKAVSDGRASKVGEKYRSIYTSWSSGDLRELEASYYRRSGLIAPDESGTVYAQATPAHVPTEAEVRRTRLNRLYAQVRRAYPDDSVRRSTMRDLIRRVYDKESSDITLLHLAQTGYGESLRLVDPGEEI